MTDESAPEAPAGAALAARQAAADALLETLADGVLQFDRQWRFTYANPVGERVLGRPRHELLGRVLWEAFPELAETPFGRAYRRAMNEGVEVTVDGFYAPFDAWFEARALPTAGGLVLLFRDVSAAKQVEREREAALAAAELARRQADEASRAKDEFLTTLSHELRTPLNAVLGWTSLLRAGGVAEAQRGRALETIERNARLQARLVDDLLDLSRVMQGKMVLGAAPVELARVVEAALDAMRPAAEAKGVGVEAALDPRALVVGDPDRLQQIAWNLLSNAIKFTPRGGHVRVLLRREGSEVELAVVDDGRGIEPAFLPHVFDRFRQQDGSSTREHGGLGLGLAIVRSLVELHGGTVGASSEGPGRGATFVVRLPEAALRARQAPPTGPSLRAPAASPLDCPPALKGLRALVVDDEPDTRTLLAYLLEGCEAKVVTASSAAEALAALGAGRFDVLVSDVSMPGEDGHALVRRLRALPPERGGRLPALALTAYARAEDRTAALQAGFSMHLPKPVDPGEFLVVVAHLAGGLGP